MKVTNKAARRSARHSNLYLLAIRFRMFIACAILSSASGFSVAPARCATPIAGGQTATMLVHHHQHRGEAA